MSTWILKVWDYTTDIDRTGGRSHPTVEIRLSDKTADVVFQRLEAIRKSITDQPVTWYLWSRQQNGRFKVALELEK